MIKFSKDSFVDISTYEKHVKVRTEYTIDSAGNKYPRNNGYLYFDKDMCNRTNEYNKVRITSLERYIRDELQMRTGFARFTNIKDGMLEYLLNTLYVPESRLKFKSTKGLSLNKKVLKNLADSGVGADLLTDYIELQSLKSKSNRIPTIMASLEQTDLVNEDGALVSKLPYNINQAVNLRYNTSDTNVVSLPKIYNPCITCPDDSIIVSADFAQADFRIFISLFVIDENNYQYFEKYTDYYEAIARLMCEANGEVFNLEKFKEERTLYKVYALETVYGTKVAQNKEEQIFVTRFNNFLDKCPRYVEYRNRLINTKKLGLNAVVTDYFGHEETADLSSSSYGGGYNSEGINFCLNSPIQSATSSVLILTVNEIMRQFSENGVDERGIQVYFPRHDEALFILKKSHLGKLWIFKNCSEIFIDNFCPLTFEFDVYHRYKVFDQLLDYKFKTICSRNIDKIDIVQRDNNFDFSYMPTKDIFEIKLSSVYIPSSNQTVVAIYYNNENKADYLLLGGKPNEVVEDIKSSVTKGIGDWLDKSIYRGVLINSSDLNDEFTYNRIYFKYKVDGGLDLVKANLLAYNMAWRYTDRENIEFEVPSSVKSNIKEIEGIEQKGIL